MRVLDLAAPLLERLGTQPEPEAVRETMELAITFWNAKAKASQLWGDPRPRQLNDLRRKMTGRRASAEDAEAFELLSQRWHDKEIAFDPRLVGDWSLEVSGAGEPRVCCETELPDGVEAHVPPPIGKRVAIGGKFLDETRIQMTANSYRCFPVEAHRGAIRDDGSVTVHTQMPTAVALLAEGVLPPIGGAAVGLTVQGKKLDAMVLSEIRCDFNGRDNDIAILVFTPASPPTAL